MMLGKGYETSAGMAKTITGFSAGDCIKKSTPFDAVFRSVDRGLRAADRAEALVAKLTGGGIGDAASTGRPPNPSVFGQVGDAGASIENSFDRINDALSRIEADLP